MKKDIDWKTEKVRSLENELSESIQKVELTEKDNLKCKGDLEWARNYCQTVNNKIKELEKQLDLTNSTTPVLPEEFKPTNNLPQVLAELSQSPAAEPPKTIKCEPTSTITPSTPKQTVSSSNNVSLEPIPVTNVVTPAPKIKKEEAVEPVPPFSLPSCSIHLVTVKARESPFAGKKTESHNMGRYTVTSTSSPEMASKVARKSLTSMSCKSPVAEMSMKRSDSPIPMKWSNSPMPVRKIEPIIDLTFDEEMARKKLDSVPAKTLVEMPRKRGRPKKIVK